MKINKIQKNTFFKGKSSGIPRFLYHLTNSDNLKKIQNSGKLQPSYSKMPVGIYLLDLHNFLKFWKSSPEWDFAHADLRLELIRRISRGTGKINILKIPTAKLKNIDKTLIRSQQKLHSYKYPPFDDYTDPHFLHLLKGDLAKNSPLYKQKKQAIEYIYPFQIEFNIVEKLGFVNLSNFTFETFNITNIMKELLKGTPEEKIIPHIPK